MMKKYDDLTELDEHVYIYVTQVNLYTSKDAILCWVFPNFLKGVTLSWFTCLPS